MYSTPLFQQGFRVPVTVFERQRAHFRLPQSAPVNGFLEIIECLIFPPHLSTIVTLCLLILLSLASDSLILFASSPSGVLGTNRNVMTSSFAFGSEFLFWSSETW